MKRNLLTVFFVIMLVLLMTACAPRENVYEENNELNKQNVTLYSLNGTMEIDVSHMQEYLSNGWYTEPVVTMYAADGRTRVTLESEVEMYKEDGWYIEPVVTVYNVDGLESVILKTEFETYQNNGWYTAPVKTVYNADGISSVILQSEIDAYVNKGWYTEPVTKIYNIDGVESLVFQRELEHYTSNGWYAAPVITMYTADGRTSVILKSEVDAYKSVGWYLPYELSDDEKAVIRAMLWGIGNSPVGEISNVSSAFLVDSVLDSSQAEYNSYNASDIVNYSKVDSFYKITNQEMIKAMGLMYNRKIDYHIPTKRLENYSGSDYTYMSPNGRGKYGEIIINYICGDNTEFLVNYTYNRYNTAENSLNKIADTSTHLIAKFSSNNDEDYPFCLKSTYDVSGNFKSMKRIYPDSLIKQKILSHYFVQYSPQDFYAERFKFNDDGTVQIVGISLWENNRKYYEPQIGSYEIKNDNSIEISVIRNGEYSHYTSFKYDKDNDCFYDYEQLVYEGETYSPEPYVVLPVDPNEKGVLYRRKVFTYSFEPIFDMMSRDWNNCRFRVG